MEIKKTTKWFKLMIVVVRTKIELVKHGFSVVSCTKTFGI